MIQHTAMGLTTDSEEGNMEEEIEDSLQVLLLIETKGKSNSACAKGL